MSGKSLFGPGPGIVLTAASDDTERSAEPKETSKRRADLIKVHLECVQPLEAAKDKLAACLEEVQDKGVASQVRGFLDAVTKIQEQVLQMTISAIRTKDSERFSVPAAATSTITPGMISGEEPLPGETK